MERIWLRKVYGPKEYLDLVSVLHFRSSKKILRGSAVE